MTVLWQIIYWVCSDKKKLKIGHSLAHM